MSSSTVIIIFMFLNLLMWTIVVDYIRCFEKKNAELQKRTADYEQKCASYYHGTFESIRKMTEMNLSAMDAFMKQLSVNIKDKGEKKDEAENRE